MSRRRRRGAEFRNQGQQMCLPGAAGNRRRRERRRRRQRVRCEFRLAPCECIHDNIVARMMINLLMTAIRRDIQWLPSPLKIATDPRRYPATNIRWLYRVRQIYRKSARLLAAVSSGSLRRRWLRARGSSRAPARALRFSSATRQPYYVSRLHVVPRQITRWDSISLDPGLVPRPRARLTVPDFMWQPQQI